MSAACVVDNEDVEPPDRARRGRDHALGRLGVGEVRLEERHAELGGDGRGASRLGAPTLRRLPCAA